MSKPGSIGYSVKETEQCQKMFCQLPDVQQQQLMTELRASKDFPLHDDFIRRHGELGVGCMQFVGYLY